MHAISNCPITLYSNESERLVGQLTSKLSYMIPGEIEGEDGDKMIEEIESALEKIASAFSRQYMGAEIYDPANEMSQSQS